MIHFAWLSRLYLDAAAAGPGGGFLLHWGASWHPLAVIGLIAAQALLMGRFGGDPVRRATWYSALGVNFYVAGMLVSAFAVRGLRM